MALHETDLAKNEVLTHICGLYLITNKGKYELIFSGLKRREAITAKQIFTNSLKCFTEFSRKFS